MLSYTNITRYSTHINVWSLAYENVNGLKVVEGDEE